MNGDEYLGRRETSIQVRDSPSVKRRVVDLAVLHPTSKEEGVSCPSNDTQDTTAYC